MPRKAREKSSTGIYHVMLRGINKQIIFEDDEDYEKFTSVIEEYKEVCGYEIYAYCLMSNHIHLLIKEGGEDLGIVFRRIGSKFVYWYNLKYNRIGHLFQDRYKSEAVENEKYFLTVLRYIHQNPIKGKIVDKIIEYPWSSYNEYVAKKRMCDINFALDFFIGDEARKIEQFKKFNAQENKDKCLDYENRSRIDDREAKDIIMKLTGTENTKQIETYERGRRDKIIKDLKNKGLSIRQIERLTGVSFGIVRKT